MATEQRGQVRGSALLLGGRVVSLGLNFATQLVLVRFLLKADYGALAFALSTMETLALVSTFNLGKAMSRFGPRYDERGDIGRLAGAVLLMTTIILVLGAICITAVHVGADAIATQFGLSEMALALVVCLAWLAPVQAFDSLVISLLANFAHPRSIFFRRHLITPLFKLAAVSGVAWAQGGVDQIAYALLIAGAAGLLINAALWLRVLRDRGLLRLHRSQIRVPMREIFAFSTPLLAADASFLLRGSMIVVLLGYFHNAAEVAAYRAVLPLAKLNDVVLLTFVMLFAPLVSRLQTRDQWSEISEAFWRTSLWIGILSFPLFAASFALAKPITVLLFGADYADSAPVLAILAAGFYLRALIGLNERTAKALGMVGVGATLDVATAIAAALVAVWLLPRSGAIGAAIAVATITVLHAVAYQIVLQRRTPLCGIPREHLRVYALLAVALAGLLAIQHTWDPPLYVGLIAIAMVSLLTIRWARHALALDTFFPELRKLPGGRWLVGG